MTPLVIKINQFTARGEVNFISFFFPRITYSCRFCHPRARHFRTSPEGGKKRDKFMTRDSRILYRLRIHFASIIIIKKKRIVSFLDTATRMRGRVSVTEYSFISWLNKRCSQFPSIYRFFSSPSARVGSFFYRVACERSYVR